MASFPRGNQAASSKKRALDFSHNDELFGSNEQQRLKRIDVHQTKGSKRKFNSSSASSFPPPVYSSSTSLLAPLSTFRTTETKDVVIQQTSAIGRLKKASFSENTLSMGYVLHVDKDTALISLPGGLTGTVECSEIFDSHHKLLERPSSKDTGSMRITPINGLLSVNQPVRCYTLGLRERANSKKQSLMLSLRPSLINRGLALKHLIPGFPVCGSIASKEDHGYVVATGIANVTSFLSIKNIPKGTVYIAGQPIECVVESVNESARTITLKVYSTSVSTALTVGSQLSLSSMMPGMLVNALIEKSLKVCITSI